MRNQTEFLCEFVSLLVAATILLVYVCNRVHYRCTVLVPLTLCGKDLKTFCLITSPAVFKVIAILDCLV